MITVDLRYISVKKNRVIQFGKSGEGSRLRAGTRSWRLDFGWMLLGFETDGIVSRLDAARAADRFRVDVRTRSEPVCATGVEPVTNREPGKIN